MSGENPAPFHIYICVLPTGFVGTRLSLVSSAPSLSHRDELYGGSEKGSLMWDKGRTKTGLGDAWRRKSVGLSPLNFSLVGKRTPMLPVQRWAGSSDYAESLSQLPSLRKRKIVFPITLNQDWSLRLGARIISLLGHTVLLSLPLLPVVKSVTEILTIPQYFALG